MYINLMNDSMNDGFVRTLTSLAILQGPNEAIR